MNEVDIVKMYVDDKASTYVIAEKYNTYPNKIRRTLKKLGIELNTRAEAQSLAIASGRAKHPTEGKPRPKEIREKISEGVFKNWQNLSEEEKQERVDKAKLQWYNMTEQERIALRKVAAEAVRQAAKDGSKMEVFLCKALNEYGYDVLFHKTGLIPNENLEVDLFLPDINVAIEIDGPSHFFPIWGEDNLQKHIKSDSKKSGLLLTYGFMVIRIKHLTKNLSEKNKRDVFNSLLPILQKVKKKFPPKGKRYIELEVN